MKLPTQKEVQEKAIKEIFEEKNIKLVIMKLELRAIDFRILKKDPKKDKDKEDLEVLRAKRINMQDAIKDIKGSLKIIKEEAEAMK